MKFYERHQGEIVYKTMSTGMIFDRSDSAPEAIRQEVYTSYLGSLARDQLFLVDNCPCLLQAYVRKLYDIRVTVVGRQVFAAEIDSQGLEVAQYDWRRAPLDKLVHRPHNLPDSVASACIEVVERLGLVFGAFDLICTPGREYVFLEVNPNGQYGWVEQLTGLNICEAVARMLARNEL